MANYTHAHAVDCFLNARNLNAALKKLMKAEGEKDYRTTRFIKAFKLALKSPKKDAIAAFVEKAILDYEEHLFVVLRHAYAPAIEAILDVVIEKYAENFNATYEVTSEGNISVLDEAAFTDLGRQALELLDSRIAAADIPSNPFMTAAIRYALFDRAVLKELNVRLV